LTCTDFEHVGNEKRGGRTEAIACVRDVSLIDIKPEIVDTRQVLDDVARTTSKIEETLAGPRLHKRIDNFTLESVRADGMLIGAEHPWRGQHGPNTTGALSVCHRVTGLVYSSRRVGDVPRASMTRSSPERSRTRYKGRCFTSS